MQSGQIPFVSSSAVEKLQFLMIATANHPQEQM